MRPGAGTPLGYGASSAPTGDDAPQGYNAAGGYNTAGDYNTAGGYSTGAPQGQYQPPAGGPPTPTPLQPAAGQL